jgi:hypothetical protein
MIQNRLLDQRTTSGCARLNYASRKTSDAFVPGNILISAKALTGSRPIPSPPALPMNIWKV